VAGIPTLTWNIHFGREKKARTFVCVQASLVRLPRVSFHELLTDQDIVDHVMSLERDDTRPVRIQFNVMKPEQRPLPLTVELRDFIVGAFVQVWAPLDDRLYRVTEYIKSLPKS
jgi:hypothetical protein